MPAGNRVRPFACALRKLLFHPLAKLGGLRQIIQAPPISAAVFRFRTRWRNRLHLCSTAKLLKLTWTNADGAVGTPRPTFADVVGPAVAPTEVGRGVPTAPRNVKTSICSWKINFFIDDKPSRFARTRYFYRALSVPHATFGAVRFLRDYSGPTSNPNP